jgi:hypothetical protein
MNIDTRFTTKLGSISDVPEPFFGALQENLPSPQEPIRLLIHTPSFKTSVEMRPATLLAVTDKGWLLASKAEGGGVSVERCGFSDTLFLEFTSILLLGQLKIDFASGGTSHSAALRFDTVDEKNYREAIDVVLAGIAQTGGPNDYKGDEDASAFKDWPVEFQNDAKEYRPAGQRLLSATYWPAVIGGFRRELAPAGALLVTERELVLIADQKAPTELPEADLQKFGRIVTYFPTVRLAGFHISNHPRVGVLALEVHARHGGEKLEIMFPSDHERAISEVMNEATMAGA